MRVEKLLVFIREMRLLADSLKDGNQLAVMYNGRLIKVAEYESGIEEDLIKLSIDTVNKEIVSQLEEGMYEA